MEIKELDKKEIRKQMLKLRASLSNDYIQLATNQIRKKLQSDTIFQKAHTIGIYASYNNEVDILTWIEPYLSLKQICFPVVKDKTMEFYQVDSLSELEKGTFGILEPTTNKKVMKQDIDLLIIPIVAFDKTNHRIGYGGGYYDRYLIGYKGKTIGLAYQLQEVDSIFYESFDLPLDKIITD